MRTGRGYLMVVVMALVFVSLTLVLSITVWQTESRLTSSRLQGSFRGNSLGSSMESRLRLTLMGEAPSGETVPLSGRWDERTYHGKFRGWMDWKESLYRAVPEKPNTGSALFQKDQSYPFPQVGYQEKALEKAFHRPVSPWEVVTRIHLEDGLKKDSAYVQSFPYAAYAPQGKISISGDVQGWANPSMEELKSSDSKPTDPRYLTGVPVDLVAQSGVDVSGDYPVGTIYSQSGKIAVRGRGGAYPVKGFNPPDRYGTALSESVDQAFSKLEDGVLNKYDYIAGAPLTNVSQFFQLFDLKNDLRQVLSIQQALEFPFIPFPTIGGEEESEIYTVFEFHYPLISDLQMADDLIQELAELPKLIKELLKAAESVINTLKSLMPGEKLLHEAEEDPVKVVKFIAWVVSHLGSDAKDFMTAASDLAKAFTKAVDGVKDNILDPLESEVMPTLNKVASFDDNNDLIMNLARTPEKVPFTKADEGNKLKTITFGWPYFEVLVYIADDLLNLLNDAEKLVSDPNLDDLDDFFQDLGLIPFYRVVHFVDRAPGGVVGDYKFEYQNQPVSRAVFPEEGGFTMAATWTVPRGKTLKWSAPEGSGKPFVVKGDVWLQRGSTMMVDGNLTIQPPTDDEWTYAPSGVSDPNLPAGALYMEEGATLVVTGNLKIVGSDHTGSVVLCTPVSPVHPITTGIFCRGTVELDRGMMPGLAVDDLAASGGPELRKLNDWLLRPLMTEIAPNVAKIFGPFHTRGCWFADYAQTWVYFEIIDEISEIDDELTAILAGPYPIPLLDENCQKTIFQYVSLFYAVELNVTLGENLYTHCDWWLTSDGTPPVFPKADPEKLIGLIESSVERELSPKSLEKLFAKEIRILIENIAKAVVQDVVVGITKEAMGSTGLADSCSPDFGGDDGGGGEDGEFEGGDPEKQAEDIIKKITEQILKDIEKKLQSSIRHIILKARDEVQKAIEGSLGQETLARELPGSFVYAGQTLSIGGDEATALFATGFLVGEHGVVSQADRTLGVLYAPDGDIEVSGELNYFPYFSRAWLYDPQSPDDYEGFDFKVPRPFETDERLMRDFFQFPIPTGGDAFDVQVPGLHRLARGTSRK